MILCSFGAFYSVKADTKPALKKVFSLIEVFCITDSVEGIYILNH